MGKKTQKNRREGRTKTPKKTWWVHRWIRLYILRRVFHSNFSRTPQLPPLPSLASPPSTHSTNLCYSRARDKVPVLFPAFIPSDNTQLRRRADARSSRDLESLRLRLVRVPFLRFHFSPQTSQAKTPRLLGLLCGRILASQACTSPSLGSNYPISTPTAFEFGCHLIVNRAWHHGSCCL